jgi:nicotinamide-nucleotide amidase
MSERRDTILPDKLVEQARQVIEANRAAGRRIAVAESCTAGLICAALTEIAGSSDVFEAGIVTYADESKTDLLKVSSDVLETFGAVSIATAWAMAQGALKATRADVSVAITGIAGPDAARAQAGRNRRVCTGATRRGPEGDRRRRQAVRRPRPRGVRLQAGLCALELLMPGASPAA